MLLPDTIYADVHDLIERAYTGFTFMLLGRDYLTREQQLVVEAQGLLIGDKPLVDIIYVLAKQRSEARYQSQKPLQELLDEAIRNGLYVNLSLPFQRTLDETKNSISRILERDKAEIKYSVSRKIQQINRIEQYAFQTKDFIDDGAEQRKEALVALLLTGVSVVLLASETKFMRDFTGEFTTMINQAVVDSSFEKYGVNAGDQLCYKKVVLDNRTSDHCKKYYLNADGSPRVYKLSELIQNGSNEGLPKTQWRPTVEKDHPNCRSQLILLPRD